MPGPSHEPPRTTEVAIIGGGVIGLSIARALALRGVKDITVFDRGTAGKEASAAAAGMLAPQAEADCVDEFFQLGCLSRELYFGFATALREETSLDIELDEAGTIYAAFNDSDVAEIDERFIWQRAAGLPIEQLTSAEARSLEPALSDQILAALRFPRDVQVDNRRLITALVRSLERLDVKLLFGLPVSRIVNEHQSVTGLETSYGFVGSRTVVIAAGAWSSFLFTADKAGSELRIEPVRGQISCFQVQPRLARHVIYSPRGYVVPRRDGRLLAGSTSEFAGFSKEVTRAGLDSIRTHAAEIFEQISRLPLIDSWAGLRPKAPDGLPVLGPCAEIEGLFYATGHYRNGILLAPITGELLAEAIVEKHISSLLLPFSPNRFALAAPQIS